MADDTLARMFWARVERGGGRPAQRFKREGAWQTLSWREMGDITREVALGLIALGRKKGEAVGRALGEPARVGPRGLRHLLGRRPDHSDLPELSAGSDPVPRQRRGDQDAHRRGRSPAREGGRGEGQDGRPRAGRGDGGLSGQGALGAHLGGAAPARPRPRRRAQERAGRPGRRRTARRHRDDRVHLGHDGPAQGGGPDPRQPRLHAQVLGADAAREGRRRPSPLPAAGALLRRGSSPLRGCTGASPRRSPRASTGSGRTCPRSSPTSSAACRASSRRCTRGFLPGPTPRRGSRRRSSSGRWAWARRSRSSCRPASRCRPGSPSSTAWPTSSSSRRCGRPSAGGCASRCRAARRCPGRSPSSSTRRAS